MQGSCPSAASIPTAAVAQRGLFRILLGSLSEAVVADMQHNGPAFFDPIFADAMPTAQGQVRVLKGKICIGDLNFPPNPICISIYHC
jgi:hypothetical protein